MNLREFARGQDCCLRIYGYCCYDSETVVLCHAVIDGREKTEYSKVQVEAMMLHGMVKTLAIVDKHFKLVPR